MSSSTAPLFPKTSIFIPAYWATARSETLTQEEADARYLRFPTGQGTESIPNLIVAGTSTLGITSASTLTAGSSTLFTNMNSVGFSAVDATGSPTYNASITASSMTSSNTNGDSNTIQAGQISIANTNNSTVYSIAGINAGNTATSSSYQVGCNQVAAGDGNATLYLTSGDLTTITPRVILQAFVDAGIPPSYVPNINLIDLGGVNGEELLISNGNSDSGVGVAYNTITLFSDTTVSNSFIELKTIDAGTSSGGSLFLGQQQFSLSITNQQAFTIGSGFTDPVVFRRNISTTTNTGLGAPVGMLENSIQTLTTTGTTTLTTSDAFATIINTPTVGTRIFVLPATTLATAGYWYAICNKSTAFTIAIQYPALTTIATIPVSPSATNGGSVVRFGVGAAGLTYLRVS
jgi:hypothetical protein